MKRSVIKPGRAVLPKGRLPSPTARSDAHDDLFARKNGAMSQQPAEVPVQSSATPSAQTPANAPAKSSTKASAKSSAKTVATAKTSPRRPSAP
ncbi:hypothetical protein [Streptomyces narbonensis]